MPACQIIPGEPGFASGMLGYFDCQAQAIGAGGYQALATPGSTAQIVLTGLLTLFVALFGFRLLFGEAPGVRDGVMAFVKIGVVIALAGSWPAYQTLIYDVVLRAPAQLASEIGTPSGIPGSGGDLAARLDGADAAFSALAVAGVGPQFQQATVAQGPPPLFIGFDTFALGGARVLYLVGAIASFAILRLIAGVLLAVGPLFVAFLLFAGTRGLFEGWLRGLIGTALGALGTAIVLGVELALLEPWLYDLLARRAAEQTIPGAPAQLLALTIVFALVLASMLAVTARLAIGLRLPSAVSGIWSMTSSDSRSSDRIATQAMTRIAHEDRSRAAAIIDAVSASQRRDTVSIANMSGGGSGQSTAIARATTTRDAMPTMAIPLGRSGGRRTALRSSASAGMRDRRS